MLNVGDKIILDGTETVVKDKWAMGAFYQYNLIDGRHLHCDLQPMIDSGRLKIVAKEIKTQEPTIVPISEYEKTQLPRKWSDRK